MAEMSMLASGSSGNCCYVSSGRAAILVDAGISRRQLIARLESLGRHVNPLCGIFITHEHSDHVRGLGIISRTYGAPVYATKKTLACLDLPESVETHAVRPNKAVTVRDFEVKAFAKMHDAAEPVGYSVSAGSSVCSIITDLGRVCKRAQRHISRADVLCIESNHDLSMLENGRYPAYLKARIGSELGHLSNYDAALAVLEHAKSDLKNLLLAHLSENNNHPDVCRSTFELVRQRRDLCSVPISISQRVVPTRPITL